MHELDARVSDLAADQHGLVTDTQLAALGLSHVFARRRREAGQWRSVAPGVHAVRGAPRTFLQRVLAAQLAAGRGALVSHRTALGLWRIRTTARAPIEVTIPRNRSHKRAGIVVHESRDLDRADPRTIQGIPVTGLARSLLDLGAVAPSRVRAAVWAARREHSLEWSTLLGTLADHGRRGRAGVGPLRQVVAAHYDEVAGDSATEDLAHALLVDCGLVPPPDRQVRVVCADGVSVTADLGWPAYRVLIEIDGVDHLTNEDLQHVDRHRRNQMELAGYTVLTYTGRLLRERPDQFVRDARDLLSRVSASSPS